jgi:hypothetical protein
MDELVHGWVSGMHRFMDKWMGIWIKQRPTKGLTKSYVVPRNSRKGAHAMHQEEEPTSRLNLPSLTYTPLASCL